MAYLGFEDFDVLVRGLSFSGGPTATQARFRYVFQGKHILFLKAAGTGAVTVHGIEGIEAPAVVLVLPEEPVDTAMNLTSVHDEI